MKSNIYRLFLIFGLLGAIVGCEKPEGNEDDKTGGTSPLSGVTIKVEDVIASSTTAIFKYSVDFGDAGDVPADVKLRYSRSESFGGESTELVSLDRHNGSHFFLVFVQPDALRMPDIVDAAAQCHPHGLFGNDAAFQACVHIG